MITCKRGALLDLNDSLEESTLRRLMNTGNEIPSIANRWKISIVVEQVSEVLSKVLKPRAEILEKYGKTTKENKWLIPNANLPDYQKEIESLRESEVEILITPLDLDIFEGSKLTIQDLILLKAAGLVIAKS